MQVVIKSEELASTSEILTRSLIKGTNLTEQESSFLRALGRFGHMLVSPSDADTAYHLAVVGYTKIWDVAGGFPAVALSDKGRKLVTK